MENHPVILFDGYCNLCNATVDFIIRHDKQKKFRFASLKSDYGVEALKKISAPANLDSVILVYQARYYSESDAGLKIVGLLGFPWNTLTVFRIIPKKIRDKIYGRIAANRYKWFGKRDNCRLPGKNEKDVFIEFGEL